MDMFKKGFTTIELIIVILIIGIMAAVTIINSNPLTDIRIGSAANKLKADIQYAQSLAMKTRVRCGVIFSGNSYTVFENNDTANPAADPLTGENYSVNFNSGDFSGVTITSANFGGTQVVKFDREGTPYDGNNNPLPNSLANRRVVLNSNIYIEVAANTGEICAP